jgi:hypothetical protein
MVQTHSYERRSLVMQQEQRDGLKLDNLTSTAREECWPCQ